MRRVNYIIALLALAYFAHGLWAEISYLTQAHYPAMHYYIQDAAIQMAYCINETAKMLVACIPMCMRQYVIDTVTVGQ
jgi:hypothetical protein